MKAIGVHLVLAAFFPWVQAQALELSGPDYQLQGSLVSVSPSALGGEVGGAALIQPISEHELLIGPKASVLLANGSGQTRADLSVGIEGILWIGNAIGSGLAVDVVAPSTITGQDSATHFRLEPTLSVRFAHYHEEGAWALRLGIPYDTTYKLGLEAGISLQFNGVPGVSSLIEP